MLSQLVNRLRLSERDYIYYGLPATQEKTTDDGFDVDSEPTVEALNQT